eukprot:9320878-Pyramimonas_sp.AAC.1
MARAKNSYGARCPSQRSKQLHEHKAFGGTPGCLGSALGWTSLPGARSAPGAAPEALRGGPSADPRKPVGSANIHA